MTIPLRDRHFDAGRIASVADAPDGWIAPAFFDTQINGGKGIGFTRAPGSVTLDDLR